MEIFHICLTGGPCAGKTTALEYISKYLKKKHIPFVTIPESATELILNRICYKPNFAYEFQTILLKDQLNKDEIASRYVELFFQKCNKCVIVHDRGIIDNKAYLNNKNEFTKLLTEHNLNEINVLDKYDLVLDLASLATCNSELYNLNNAARSEDLKTAQELDFKTSNAWVHHRNFRLINTSIPLKQEKKIIINYIKDLLNHKDKHQITRLLLEDKESDYTIYNQDNSEKILITNYYLNKYPNYYYYVVTKREHKQSTSYTYTIYQEKNGLKFIIYGKQIDASKYFELLKNNDIISKDVHQEISFFTNLQKYQLCFYENETFLEFEENQLNNELVIPDNLKIVQKVSKNDDYPTLCRKKR